MALFETIIDLKTGSEVLRRRRYGVIEVANGRLLGVHLRPWAKVVSIPEGLWLGGRYHERHREDRCLLYYNQPLGHSNFLALKYVRSGRGTTLATFRATLTVLDEIARLKRSDASLTDVSNVRISDRLLARWGWEAHCPSRWHRHFIKRYYGNYADPAAAWRLMSAPAELLAPALTVAAPGEAPLAPQPSLTDASTQREPLGV
ncbi:MAG: hypothetical protein KF708_23200 [Pirellulales bacterium]|nr:hypothetical protein [Pirellulales bacterium]